jgi:hypothetical protein
MRYSVLVFWLTSLTLALAGCVSVQTPVEMTSTPTPTLPPPIPTSITEGTSRGEAFSSEEAQEYMDLLISDDPDVARSALEELQKREDKRFVSVLIELMRAEQIGLIRGAGYLETSIVLESLSGQTFGLDWLEWVEWYGASDLTPPPGFTTWKGKLLGRIDSRFALFLHDDLPTNIRTEEIQWGGVVVDGIPALDNPEMIEGSESNYPLPSEPVFGISINGDARAYPLRILDWHEMANDIVGGVPVSLAYCTLCGAAIAYDGRAGNGDTYTFGSSGFLFRSNKLMYDRQTQTLWNQLTGEPVLGTLVGQDIQLKLLPVVLTSWEAWKRQHPDTKVLSLETGYERLYLPGAAYGDYFAADETMFPVWQRSDLLDTKDRVFALRVQGVPKAYPLDLLVAELVVNDTFAETPIVLVAQGGSIEVDGIDLRAGEVTYDAGAEVRAYLRGEEVYSPGTQPDTVLDSMGRTWEVTEDALIGPDGQTAPRLSGHLAYWFGWYAFFPNTLIFGVD